MSWIKHIPYDQAEGKLLKLYKRVKGPDNNVDNIMLAHSLRPHTMEGHMALYKNVLHHLSNEIPKWFLEVLGVYTSLLNQCEYCVEHHYNGMSRLIKDDKRSQAIRLALETENFTSDFEEKQSKALEYAKNLTVNAHKLTKNAVIDLRNSGWDDGEILEINQVVAYFNYANRTVLGLGVYSEGDILGLSPNQSHDPDNWQHQ
ncbi:MAG: alkylhydroperoxidase [Gammaproteobacteria bacterium]|nr:MAG: alkylhydroperoxidase [Gammaproteobacteria bacterium]